MSWTDGADRLISFIKELEARKINFQLNRNNSYSITVTVVVPGEYWEVDFCESGEIQVEVFRSNGDVTTGTESIERINRMLAENTD